MYILEKIDHILGKVYEQEVLTWEDVQKLCPKSTKFAAKTSDFLYRGSRDYRNEYGKALIRTDRMPLNTDISTHNRLDTAFNQVFGVKLRSASLFCTGFKRDANGYGKLYEIYPSDDFNLYWSNNIKDFYLNKPIINAFYRNNIDKTNKPIWLAAQVKFRLFSPSWFEGMQDWLEKNCSDFMKKYYCSDFTEFERSLWRKSIADEFVNAVLKASNSAREFENLEKDLTVNFIKIYYKQGNSESAWKEAIQCKNEIMVTASFYCYKYVKN